MAKESKKFGNSKTAMIIMVFILAIYSLVLILMYLWGISTSLKSVLDYESNKIWLPSGSIGSWSWQNYSKVLEIMKLPVMQWNGGEGKRVTYNAIGELKNSLIYAIGSPLITLTTTWIVAYCLSRFPNKFSKIVYTANIIFMMIPLIGNLPSALQVYRALKLYDTWGYIFVSSISFLGSNLLIFHSFLNGIGKEYSESALIDGANNFTVMLKIIFPLCSQMFLILFIMAFVVKWNDYMTMVIWMPGHPTISYGVLKVSSSTSLEAAFPPVKIAACVVLMVPVIVLFLIFQDKMMGNLRMGALKG